MNDPIDSAMAAMRQRISSPAWADDFSWPQPVGTELDGLAQDIPEREWSAERRAAIAALRAIKPMHRLAVLTMARDEAPYLAEFFAHYFAIGANKIFVYTNDNSDGTADVLRWFADCTPVVPIFMHAGPGVNVQHKNYGHALFLLPELRLYDWVLLVDVDEFLIPAAIFQHHLPTMLAAAPADTDTILFPWRWRCWERSFERGAGLLAERYQHATGSDTCKSVMRMGRVTSLLDVHVPRLEPGGVYRDSRFEVIERVYTPGESKSTQGGWVDHYWGKSFEEFLIKKRRGDALELDLQFKRDYSNFFEWAGNITPGNAAPLPGAMLAAMKFQLARFSGKAGFEALMAKVEAEYGEYAWRVRQDPEIQQIYTEHMARYPIL
jgi:hypothetical protein